MSDGPSAGVDDGAAIRIPKKPQNSAFAAKDFAAGDIVWATVPYDQTEGHEQSGDRPWVVLSSRNLHNRQLGVVMMAPCTSQFRHELEFPEARIRILRDDIENTGGLYDGDQLVLTEHMRSMSVERIRARAGRVTNKKTINALRGALAYLLDIDA